VHSLSLDWHLKKKMGNVLRSMDRGVNASNTVVTYLLLYLGPTIAECVAVFIIFYLHFSLPLLSSATFVAFGLYTLCTVRITLWRKKFRERTNRHDNAFHDKATDSLINFETVKYFTTEDFEVRRYVQSVQQFQKHAVNTQLSLSFLNVSQQTIIALCSAVALCIAAHEVRTGTCSIRVSFLPISSPVLIATRARTCARLLRFRVLRTQYAGCRGSMFASLLTLFFSSRCECSTSTTGATLKIGDFVSVNMYIVQLFAPLTFLGSGKPLNV
jgi:ABC-type transport system involved in Fe-S cluster assembly fused permease/ATPase subunit